MWSYRRGLTQVLTQEYVGRDCDITIMPWKGHVSLPRALFMLLRNPSPEDFKMMVTVGERNTWQHLSRVRSHCLVEVCLEKCVQRLRKKVLEESIERDIRMGNAPVGMKNRVPSFYTSPSLINLSGLSVADPVVMDHRPKSDRSIHSAQALVEDSPDLAVDRKRRNLEHNQSERADDEVGLATNPSNEDMQNYARQAAASVVKHTNPGIIKSSSMANFYYRRSYSEENLEQRAHAGTARRKSSGYINTLEDV